MFIVYTSLKSLLRQPLIASLLLINITIVTASLLLILSMLNAQWEAYQRNDNTRIIALQTFPMLKEMIDRAAFWETEHPAASITLGGAVVKLPITYNKIEGVYSVAGLGKNRTELGKAAANGLRPGECLLSYSLAVKLGGGSPQHLVGQDVFIADNTFTITGILKNVDLDMAFIAYESLHSISDPIVTTVFIQTVSMAVIDDIVADLSLYRPKLVERDNAESQAALKRELMQYAGLTIALAAYSLASFLQLFQYKLRRDSYRWGIFSIFGARRSHLIGSALIESFGIVVIAFGLGLLLFAAFNQFVHLPYVLLAYDTNVLVTTGALSFILFAFIAVLLSLSIHRRRDGLARISA